MTTPELAAVARLIGEPARAAILTALLGGRALTALELACDARVTPQTASSHLRRLTHASTIDITE
ncbi:MAG: helix-turn-helix transcriptional regulator [Burkholderiales bacterium]|nr:helix-turn-helix transcriptional regulator [Burkholderiales bacterium]